MDTSRDLDGWEGSGWESPSEWNPTGEENPTDEENPTGEEDSTGEEYLTGEEYPTGEENDTDEETSSVDFPWTDWVTPSEENPTGGWIDDHADIDVGESNTSIDSGYKTETPPQGEQNSTGVWGGWSDSDLALPREQNSTSSREVSDWDPVREEEATSHIDPKIWDWVPGMSIESVWGPKPPDPNEIKYNQLPFRTRHLVHTYCQRILEDTCFRYAQKQAHLFGDLEWKRCNLLFRSEEWPREDRYVNRDWLAEDGIELEIWTKFLGRNKMNSYPHVLRAVCNLRNAAVHRDKLYDGRQLSFDDFWWATKFPSYMGDQQCYTDIMNVYLYVIEDESLDEKARASLEEAMSTPPPCTNRYRLLGRIQTLLEETCFNHAKRQQPETFTGPDYEMHEQTELGDWRDLYHYNSIHHDKSANEIFGDMDDDCLKDSIYNVNQNIRNVVAHRTSMSECEVVERIQRAIYICILQSDWNQAIEVEILAEMFFTSATRREVLDRLESVYRDGKIPGGKVGIAAYERARRVAVRAFLEREGIEVPKEDDRNDDFDAKLAVGTESFGKGWTQKTWSYSMHECLLRLELDRYALV